MENELFEKWQKFGKVDKASLRVRRLVTRFTVHWALWGVVVKHWQREQRLSIKKQALKWIMFENNILDEPTFPKCIQSVKIYTHRCYE